MKIASAQEMRDIDKSTIEWFGLPGVALMENAGRAVAEKAISLLDEPRGKIVFIVCGGGNNGGDGYVAARWLHNCGARVKLFLAVDRTMIQGDALIHLETALRMGVECFDITEPRSMEKARIAAAFADLVIDALLGTGFHGELSEPYRDSIELINSAGRIVLSVDIPSGVEADTGMVREKAVRAFCTVTFGLPKLGLWLYPGADFAGRIEVAPIGIPAELLTAATIRQTLLTQEYAASLLPRRLPDSHKGSFGHVMVIGGSRGMSGAVYLAAQGALRTGAGLVTAAVPAGIGQVMEIKTTEAMTLELPETLAGGLGSEAVKLAHEFSARASVVLAGPGLGRQEETMDTVRELVTMMDRPLVLDADALFALSGHSELLSASEALTVLTPHPGEMARLTGLSVRQIQADRIGVARRFAVEWKSIVVLKGPHTVVAFPDGEIYVNPTGNSGMASGGMGDVLAGMIAALIAQGLSSHDAAVLGVYLHGLAGDRVAANQPAGMTAMDLAEQIPATMGSLMV
ncbi:MAG: NAD(P)H-hydrate dehydratase [Veillonellaceae bacterium]|nr:NAD(P)H-hydrate dehydratase [Veillonellaceae bacterium]